MKKIFLKLTQGLIASLFSVRVGDYVYCKLDSGGIIQGWYEMIGKNIHAIRTADGSLEIVNKDSIKPVLMRTILKNILKK